MPEMKKAASQEKPAKSAETEVAVRGGPEAAVKLEPEVTAPSVGRESVEGNDHFRDEVSSIWFDSSWSVEILTWSFLKYCSKELRIHLGRNLHTLFAWYFKMLIHK